jgi:phospholipid N-methyltransferase
MGVMHVVIIIGALALELLSQLDLRWIEKNVESYKPSQSSVTNFYNKFGGILMNDLYHHLFEYTAMKDMMERCDFQPGDNIVEIGPGSGFLADHILERLNDITAASKNENKRSSLYYGIEVSSTMYEKASERVNHHLFSRQKDAKLANVQMNLVSDSVQFSRENITFPVDKFILTYVMDLMPQEDLRQFVDIFHSKLRSKESKICIVNLTYGFTPLSRIVTNLWQILYVTLGGHNVGGCRPLNILEYFNKEKGFELKYKNYLVSTGLPSEVAIVHKV